MPQLGINISLPCSKVAVLSSTPPVPEANYVFKTLSLSNAVAPMDGPALLQLGSGMRMYGGWDGVAPTFATIYDTTDTITFTPSADVMPYPMHTFNAGAKNNFTENWTWGGDFQLGTNPVVKYTEAGVELISADVSGTVYGQRFLSAGTIHNDYLYALGGQSDDIGTIVFTDVVRSLDGLAWEVVGSLPPGFYSAGCLYSINGVLVYCGGGDYSQSTLNDKVFKSTDNGANWIETATFPVGMRSIYCTGAVWDNKLWFLNGSDIKGLSYSSDLGVTWTELYDAPTQTHGNGMCVFNDELYITFGAFHNYSYKVYKAPLVTEIPTGAFAMYTLKLPTQYAAYTGLACTLRRASDDVEESFNFTAGEWPWADIITFGAGGAVFAKVFGDATGNGHPLTQLTESKQYQVLDGSGQPFLQNGEKALWAEDGNRDALTSVLNDIGTNYCLSAVVNVTETNREIFGAYLYGIYNSPDDKIYHNAGNIGSAFGQYPVDEQIFIQLYRRDQIVQVYVNGRYVCDSFLLSSNAAFNFTSISGEGDPAYNLIGYIQQAIIFATDELDVKKGMDTEVKSMYNISGI